MTHERPSHIPELDGLRAVAVLLVLWSHVHVNTPGYPRWLAMAAAVVAPGNLGVEIFFVLSGFLITRILLAERERDQPVRWFLLRRMLRIFPIYYLLLAVMAVLQPSPAVPWCAVYLSNLHFIWHSQVNYLGHTWSLSVEEHFYLLWPLAVAFLPVAWSRRTMLWFVMPATVILAVIVCGSIDDPVLCERIVRLASPCRFLGMGAGCLMAFHERALRAHPWPTAASGLAVLAAGAASWPVFWIFRAPEVVGTGLPIRYGPALWLLHSTLVAGGIVLYVLGAAFAKSCITQPLAIRLPRAIGRISYGLYLYHMPVFGNVLRGEPSLLRVGAAFAATFALATASYLIVERPLLRFGKRFR